MGQTALDGLSEKDRYPERNFIVIIVLVQFNCFKPHFSRLFQGQNATQFATLKPGQRKCQAKRNFWPLSS